MTYLGILVYIFIRLRTVFTQYFLCALYTEPKKKLSQNRTSRWAYSLRKKKKKNRHLPQMKLKYQMKLMIFRLYMNFDELIFNHCAITNKNKNC